MAKNKKDKNIIVEEEPVVIDEKSIVPAEELSKDEGPKMPEFKKLICRQSFTDKFNDEIVYQIGDELNITDVARRKDLIERGLAVEE